MISAIAVAMMFAQGPIPGAATAPPQTAPAVQAKPDQPWPPAGVARLGKDVIAPKLVKDTKPSYTAEAMDAKVEGRVLLEAIVGVEGTITDVRVKQSLDRTYGLDDQAVKALRTWRFEPGRKGGTALPVLVEVEMTFSLR